MSDEYNLRTGLAAERRQGLRYEAEIASLKSQLEEALKDRERLRPLIEDYKWLLSLVEGSRKCSIGSIDNTYELHINVGSIASKRERFDAAMKAEKNG